MARCRLRARDEMPATAGALVSRQRKEHSMSRLRVLSLVCVCLVAVLGTIAVESSLLSTPRAVAALTGIPKIQHVVIIMQENRSFDSYFGTYPGADGIPRKPNGQFIPCLPDARSPQCVTPYHDRSNVNGGGSHASQDFVFD